MVDRENSSQKALNQAAERHLVDNLPTNNTRVLEEKLVIQSLTSLNLAFIFDFFFYLAHFRIPRLFMNSAYIIYIYIMSNKVFTALLSLEFVDIGSAQHPNKPPEL